MGGTFNPPIPAERMKLSAVDLARGQRLACQLWPRGAGEILIEDPAPPSDWKSRVAA